ncbi:MAG: hypothetical protein BalsKO_24920 [Balneolaceae bacterium]
MIADSEANTPKYSQGIKPVISSDFPFKTTSAQGVAKLYKGNSVSVNGVFVSNDGLFLTNYSSILEYISASSEPGNSLFQKGLIASSKSDEVLLEGIALMIEVEQKDVTKEVQKEITELSPNSEIYQSIQRQKNLLINERRGERTDLLVEIQDSYSGLNHIMTVYEVINDVRLVFAPALDINETNAHSSQHILNEITDEFVLLRAYNSSENTPYSPGHFFPLTRQLPEKATSLTALGFPSKTYRLETSRAIRFYNEQLNPTVLSSFEIFLKKEDTLATIDNNFSLKSIPNRFSLAQNVQFFRTAQDLIAEYDIVLTKQTEEQEFLSWIESDTTLPETYPLLFNFIDQAYDIAEQTSDIYFTSNYFNNFSFLDNLASVYRSYLENQTTAESEKELDSLKVVTLETHQELLSQTNIGAELFMLKRFLISFANVQEKQKPLILFDLFSGTAGTDLEAFSIRFVDEIAPTSFLLDLNRAQETLSSGSFFDDPLFALLDEILFTQESSQQSYLLHYAYLYPAQQVYTEARLERSSSKKITPDANTSLAFNVGVLDPSKTSLSNSFFYTTNDFSGKTPGTAILNSEGELVGLVSDEINNSILGNYVYNKDASFLKALRVSSIIEEILNTSDTDTLLEELGQK